MPWAVQLCPQRLAEHHVDMADALETLLAKQAITEVLHTYCYAMDRNDPVLGARVWHPDGMAHYGAEIFDGPAAGYLTWVFEMHAQADGTSHQLSNILISVDGDRATSESYVHACIRMGGNDLVVRGRYLDSWSCRDGEWRIDERRYETDLTQVIASGTWPRAVTTDPATRRTGRPRDASIDARALAAARRLLVEDGFAATTIQAIAEHSGVHASAIYRRWPSRFELIEDAAFAGFLPDTVAPTGDLRRDLARFLQAYLTAFDSPVVRAAMPGLLAGTGPGAARRRPGCGCPSDRSSRPSSPPPNRGPSTPAWTPTTRSTCSSAWSSCARSCPSRRAGPRPSSGRSTSSCVPSAARGGASRPTRRRS